MYQVAQLLRKMRIKKMPSFFTALSPRLYLGIAFIVVAIGSVSYVNNLKSDLVEERQAKEDTQTKLDEANKNNELTIQAYEQTLAIEKEKNTFEITTQKEKEPLIKISEKVKQEVEKVKKYKEVKQDGKECPKLGTFKL